jgi:hypothetical protein
MAWFDGQGGNPPPFSPGYLVEGVQPATTFAGALGLVLPFMNVLKANVGLMMTGAFGLGPLQFDAKAQLSAALSAQLSWNPSAAIAANAQVGLALSGLIPNFAVNAGLVADLQLKIGGIQLLLNLGLGIIANLPPRVAGITGFMTLPGGYFGVYYGNPNTQPIRQFGQIANLIGGANGMCFVVMAFGTSVIGAAEFKTSIGGIFATSPT